MSGTNLLCGFYENDLNLNFRNMQYFIKIHIFNQNDLKQEICDDLGVCVLNIQIKGLCEFLAVSHNSGKFGDHKYCNK